MLQLAACSVNPPLQLADLAGPGATVMLDGVPFHPQEAMQCGPAALAGVLGAAGVETTPQALAPQVYLPGREGSLQVELLAATRRAGRVAWQPDTEPAALLAELQLGRPVLVMQNLRTPSLPAWHYAVLVGFDAGRNEMVLNSGTRRGLRVDARTFLRTWDWAGRWAMVALPPGELPARPDPARLFSALASFEYVAGAAAAESAWQAAAGRYPADGRLRLALGNLAHARGEQQLALRHYRAGWMLAPGDAALGNNLASVLGELGCQDEARSVLEPLLASPAVDADWRSELERTLAELPAAGPRRVRCLVSAARQADAPTGA